MNDSNMAVNGILALADLAFVAVALLAGAVAGCAAACWWRRWRGETHG